MSEAAAGRLRHLPLPLFGAPMGLGGLGLAWREAARSLGAPAIIGDAILVVMLAVFLLLVLLHGLRHWRHPDALYADLRHPVRSAFAGGVTICTMLSAAAIAPWLPAVAENLWLCGAVLHLALAAHTLRRLLDSPGDTALMPPLLIPLVGNLLVPTIGARFGHPALCWVGFGVGAGLWLLLQPLLLHRVIAGPPLPPRLRPTLVIFLAPPAVICLALQGLEGGMSVAGLAAFGLGCLVAASLLLLAPGFARLPFAVSWWAFSFPTAAFALTCMGFAQAHPAAGAWALAWLALLLSSAVIALVAARTLAAAARGELLQPDG